MTSNGVKKFIIAILLLEVLLVAVLLISSDTAFAQDTVELPNPILGADSVGALVTKAIGGFIALLASIAIAFTVFSGFKLVVATNEEAIKNAKSSITWSVGGFIVALLAFTLVSGVADIIGFAPEGAVPESNILNPYILNIPGGPGESITFISVLNFIMINFLGLIGFATILMIIYYGYRYITAAGNEDAIASAKSGFKWAILGLIITLLAFTLIQGARQFFITAGG